MSDPVRHCPKCGHYYDDECQQRECPHEEILERRADCPPKSSSRLRSTTE